MKNVNGSPPGGYALKFNPFPPAAAGIDIEEKRKLYMPESWMNKIESYISSLSTGEGPKAFPIIGKYGSGKTVLLRYLGGYFQERGVYPFLFDNPGLQFYDLANSLMRGVGRYEFAKSLWELGKPHIEKSAQLRLIPMSFSEWLSALSKKTERNTATTELQKIIKDKLSITPDEEIAYRLSLVVAETAVKPYFEYRDFVVGTKGTLVAEKEEAPYFKALIKALTKIYNVRGIVFLIDEFEDVALYRRMPKRKAHEYLATLRRLISISETENLWIILSTTPEAAHSTRELDPALWQRFTQGEKYKLELNPLEPEEAKRLLTWWLDRARPKGSNKRGTLLPFPDTIVDFLQEPELRYPRPLVRIGFFILSEAMSRKEKSPFSKDFAREIIESIYPPQKSEERNEEQGK
ncbi:MAG: hypothetical protein HWN66_13030 [Candidatus Helarchaeota archaeon]|nr:hypothetical protein [Candidatus Helarchaeota archaeon]